MAASLSTVLLSGITDQWQLVLTSEVTFYRLVVILTAFRKINLWWLSDEKYWCLIEIEVMQHFLVIWMYLVVVIWDHNLLQNCWLVAILFLRNTNDGWFRGSGMWPRVAGDQQRQLLQFTTGVRPRSNRCPPRSASGYSSATDPTPTGSDGINLFWFINSILGIWSVLVGGLTMQLAIGRFAQAFTANI